MKYRSVSDLAALCEYNGVTVSAVFCEVLGCH